MAPFSAWRLLKKWRELMTLRLGPVGIRRTRAALVMMMGVLLSTAITSAQGTKCWTMVGSTGTVPPTELGLITTSLNKIAVRTDIGSAVVHVRYNIVAVDGLLQGEAQSMRVRFTDNGSSAQVRVRLLQTNIRTGLSTIVAELDSNSFKPSSVAQVQSTQFGCQALDFDFQSNIYYVDVTLLRTGPTGSPDIRGLQICPTVC
jgi:hypothetical protein